ncbi:MAG TPA: dicarboxylate/amino acid:cation symporter [Longimicrobiaceae bacterium]|nr:dicarboxylate/amino acid:cation symporter [Longimicrobiaceae bacterium]
MSPTTRILVALGAGLGAGITVSVTQHPVPLAVVSAIEPLGTLWVNAIRMTVIPLVVSLLVTGIASSPSEATGRVGGRTLVLFLLLVTASSLLAAAAVPPLFEPMRLDPAAVEAVRARLPDTVPQVAELPPFRDWLTSLIPTNPVRAAADGAMLPLIIFTIIAALALTRLPAEHRDFGVRIADTVARTMFVVVGWILALAPFGVFFLTLPLAARLGLDLAGALGRFFVVTCGLLVVATLSLYPLVALAGIPMRSFARAVAPAQVVAFTTRSSLASLPALVDGAERRLGLPVHVTGLTLPVAVAVFKFGSPIARIAGTLLVARIYGVELEPAAVAAISAAIGLLSFYSPGIPSGGLFVMAPLYTAFGLPVEGIGLLIAVDMIPDLFITPANVTGDMAVAAVLGVQSAASPAPAPRPIRTEEREPALPADAGAAR